MAKRSRRRTRQSPLGNINDIMGQLQQLQQQVESIQAEIAATSITGSAGGGAVKVTLNGDYHCQEVFIDPALLEDAEADMLQDLVMAAINQAVERIKQLSEEKMGGLTGGLGGMMG